MARVRIRSRNVERIPVRSGTTISPGTLVSFRVGGVAGTQGRLESHSNDKDLIFLGVSINVEDVAGNLAGTVLCPVDTSGAVIEDILNSTDNNPDLGGQHLWTPDGIVVIFDNPSPTAHDMSPVAIALRYLRPDPVTSGSFWDIQLFTPGEFKALREGKKASYLEP